MEARIRSGEGSRRSHHAAAASMSNGAPNFATRFIERSR
jgi:hypothetical protein